MPVARAVALEIDANRPQSVWELLGRTALRGIDLAARLFRLDEDEAPIERAELFVSYGVTPLPPRNSTRASDWGNVDWAKLGELERARVAREMTGSWLP